VVPHVRPARAADFSQRPPAQGSFQVTATSCRSLRSGLYAMREARIRTLSPGLFSAPSGPGLLPGHGDVLQVAQIGVVRDEGSANQDAVARAEDQIDVPRKVSVVSVVRSQLKPRLGFGRHFIVRTMSEDRVVRNEREWKDQQEPKDHPLGFNVPHLIQGATPIQRPSRDTYAG
jgi:hypothetical protein